MKAITIGIIDDDKIYHLTTRKIIKALGFDETILSFFDGDEALQYLKENIEFPVVLPDTIFLDVNMPHMDGWDFLNEFIRLRPELPKGIVIYMITSSLSELDTDRAKKYRDLSGYHVKPINELQFQALIDNVLVA